MADMGPACVVEGEVDTTRHMGVVRRFNLMKKFGFIGCSPLDESGVDEVFVHLQDIVDAKRIPVQLLVGDEVSWCFKHTRRGPQAVDIIVEKKAAPSSGGLSELVSTRGRTHNGMVKLFNTQKGVPHPTPEQA